MLTKLLCILLTGIINDDITSIDLLLILLREQQSEEALREHRSHPRLMWGMRNNLVSHETAYPNMSQCVLFFLAGCILKISCKSVNDFVVILTNIQTDIQRLWDRQTGKPTKMKTETSPFDEGYDEHLITTHRLFYSHALQIRDVSFVLVKLCIWVDNCYMTPTNTMLHIPRVVWVIY